MAAGQAWCAGCSVLKGGHVTDILSTSSVGRAGPGPQIPKSRFTPTVTLSAQTVTPRLRCAETSQTGKSEAAAIVRDLMVECPGLLGNLLLIRG